MNIRTAIASIAHALALSHLACAASSDGGRAPRPAVDATTIAVHGERSAPVDPAWVERVSAAASRRLSVSARLGRVSAEADLFALLARLDAGTVAERSVAASLRAFDALNAHPEPDEVPLFAAQVRLADDLDAAYPTVFQVREQTMHARIGFATLAHWHGEDRALHRARAIQSAAALIHDFPREPVAHRLAGRTCSGVQRGDPQACRRPYEACLALASDDRNCIAGLRMLRTEWERPRCEGANVAQDVAVYGGGPALHATDPPTAPGGGRVVDVYGSKHALAATPLFGAAGVRAAVEESRGTTTLLLAPEAAAAFDGHVAQFPEPNPGVVAVFRGSREVILGFWGSGLEDQQLTLPLSIAEVCTRTVIRPWPPAATGAGSSTDDGEAMAAPVAPR